MDEKRQGDWLQTHTGRKFYPLDPQPDDIDIIDIAHALSNICRFTGHCKTHYNVAQHSVLVSANVSDRAALYGLLHDAAEAYIGDISRPMKKCIQISCGYGLKEIEQRIVECICKKYLVIRDASIEAEVKMADDLLLVTEARDLMSPLADGWRHHPANGYQVLPDKISPWTPNQSYYEFLQTFDRIRNRR
jgi:hypothetical protein